jgi:hypothetical protein
MMICILESSVYISNAVDCGVHIVHCKSLTRLLFSDPRNLLEVVGRPRYMAIFVCKSDSRCSVVVIIPHCVCNVAVALLLVKYMRIASVIGYGVLLSTSGTVIWFLYAK